MRRSHSLPRPSRATALLVLVTLGLLAFGLAIVLRSTDAPSRSSDPLTRLPTVETDTRATELVPDLPAALTVPVPPASAAASDPVETAVAFVEAFGGEALLDPEQQRALVARFASADTADALASTLDAAAQLVRSRLGVDSVPAPRVILRAVPIGVRLERRGETEARVAVWYVGLVGSGATVDPQQFWQTETLTLVADGPGWRVRSFSSQPGPTPPLPTTATTSDASTLFDAVPRFEEIDRAS